MRTDAPSTGRGRKKPWRYGWPDELRDEVLARLLDVNKKRAEAEWLAGGAGGAGKAGGAKAGGPNTGKGRKGKAKGWELHSPPTQQMLPGMGGGE